MSKNSVHLEDSLGSVFPQSQIFPIESEFFQGKAIVLIHGIHEHLENGISPVPSNYFQ